jgi:hypothetical protein
MTQSQKQDNRSKPKRSTGPRTEVGKSRASRNAIRHGLAAVALRDPAVPAQIERMAKEICGNRASRMKYEQALKIAENEHMLLLVRAARMAAIERIMLSLEHEARFGEPRLEKETASKPSEKDGLQRALAEIVKYERYERRALSRRQRAIQILVALSVLEGAVRTDRTLTAPRAPP